MELLDLKYDRSLQITNDCRPILNEIKSRYCPLYELKMTSQIEDINSEFSLIKVANAQKAQHAVKMAEQRAQQAALMKKKHKELQEEIERRSR